MKYMLIWWLLSQPFIIHHGPCVEEDVAWAALVLKKMSNVQWQVDVVPCGTKLQSAR